MSDATLTVKVVASDQSDKFGTLCQLCIINVDQIT